MGEETKQCLIVCGSSAVVLMTIILSIMTYNISVVDLDKAAMEAGYVKGVVPGSSSLQWIKPEKE